MADVMRGASAWIAGKLKAHASGEVAYSRGQLSVTLRATGGPKPLQATGDVGTRIEWANRDWLIAAADLVLGGEAAEPRKGDRVREAAGGVTYVYEVLAPPGEPVWRWSDAHQVLMRIHSKPIGTE